MNTEYIHPNAPPKLVKAYRKAGSYHKLADEINVNVRYVYELITEGKEPPDTTPKLREIRHRLGLRKRKPRDRARQPKPPMQQAIEDMTNDTKQPLISIMRRRPHTRRDAD